MSDSNWIQLALELAVPLVVGLAVVQLRRRAAIRSSPVPTSLVLFALLAVMAGLLAPGGDVILPAIGGITSAVVCAGVYVELRRRRRLGPS
jgi:hypothetical protein